MKNIIKRGTSLLLVLAMLLTVRLRKKSHPVFGGMALGSIRG